VSAARLTGVLSGTDWGLPRLASHGLVLMLALLGAALAPLGFHQGSADAVATASASSGLARIALNPSTMRAPSSIRPDSAAFRAVQAAPQPTTADLAENLHHLARFLWPAKGTITTYFSAYHPGIDIANVEGSPEVAADAGRVVFAGWGDYGIYVEIDHGNGFHTIYGHLSEVQVRVGDLVSPGQPIGLMGSTGRSTGPHVHFEIVFEGVPQNPLDLLQSPTG